MNSDSDGGVGEAISQVATDARDYARARLALYRAIGTARLRVARLGIALVLFAAVLAFAAVGALLVGLILTLTPMLGAFGATALVVVVTLLLAGLLGWVGARRIAAATGPIA